jgi:hypothetical protein
VATNAPGCVGQFCCWPEYVVKSAMAQPEKIKTVIVAVMSDWYEESFLF